MIPPQALILLLLPVNMGPIISKFLRCTERKTNYDVLLLNTSALYAQYTMDLSKLTWLFEFAFKLDETSCGIQKLDRAPVTWEERPCNCSLFPSTVDIHQIERCVEVQ